MAYKPQPGGEVDTGNSSATPLGIGGIFTGDTKDGLDGALIYVTAFSDVTSADNGLEYQISSDGVTGWRTADQFTIPAGKEKTEAFQLNKNFYRIVYTNGGTGQSTFDLHTVLKEMNGPLARHRIKDPISDQDDASLTIAVVKGEDDLTGLFENVKLYRGAMQVDTALVHRVGISEHVKRINGWATTLDIAASTGDTVINVASTAGVSVGDLTFLYNTTVTERSHFHIVAINAGVSVTLNRPIDNDFEIGDHLDEIEISMNQVGTLASPLSFKIEPIGSERFQITRILPTMLDSSSMDDAKFGGLTKLTNGVVVRVNNNGTVRTLTHWHSNDDLKDDMYDVTYSDKAPASQFGLSGRWTFTKGQFVVDLDGSTNDYLEILIQDDLSGLDNFQIKAQGRLFGG